MRFLELFLTVLVSTCSITTGLPHSKSTKDKGYRLVIDPQLTLHQQLDAIADVLNNDALGVFYANVTYNYDYSSGNQGTTTQTVEDTFEYIGESTFMSSEYRVLFTKGNDADGNDYELANIMNINIEFSVVDDGVIHIKEEGQGAEYQKLKGDDDYTFSGNITLTGGGANVQLNSTLQTYALGLFQVLTTEDSVTTNAMAIELTQSIIGDKAYTTGYENTITDFIIRTEGSKIKPMSWREIIDRNSRYSKESNYLFNLYVNVNEEAPIPGVSGQVTETSTGYYDTPNERYTVSIVGEGYEWFEEGSIKNNIPALMWRAPRFNRF